MGGLAGSVTQADEAVGRATPGSGAGWAAAPQPGAPAARIDRFVLLAELGRGGMGVVYRAHDHALDRAVAIKVLGANVPLDERHLARFEREARTAARLRHPGIVAVHEVGRAQHGPLAGRPYLVMDLVEGHSLEALLRARLPPPRRTAEIVREAALALEHAHREGVVHRDVKPENVLVERDGAGRVYVSDFGLAREIDSGDHGLTRSGQIIGTPAYMAPEQGSGKPVGPAADIYGLGGVLYRALAGRPPFCEEQLMALLRQVLVEEPPPLRKIAPSVHPDLETIAHRCLQKEPARRYPSAAALAEDLDRFCAGELIQARPIGRRERLARWTRRNPVSAALAGGLAVLLLAGAAAGAVLLAEMRRRVAAERAAVVAEAARSAEEACAAFEEARSESSAVLEVADGDTDWAREARDALLARGLAAVKASATHHALAPDEDAARKRAFETQIAYGEVALAAEQWAVAATAFDGARALDVDRVRADALRARLDRERDRRRREERETVEAIIEQARSGALAARPGGREDAVFALVRHPSRQTVQLLVAALDAVTERLREALRAVLIEASTSEGSAADADEAPIEGLSEWMAKWLEAEPVEAIERAPWDDGPGARAAERLLGNEQRRRVPGTPASAVSVRSLIAAEQARRVGEGELALARVAAEALGRIGIREAAVDALARHLAAEMDELRAIAASEALCRLAGPRARRLIEAGRDRFGPNGTFWRRMVPLLEQPEPDASGAGPRTPQDYLDRAITRHGKRDLRGALEDYDHLVKTQPPQAVLHSNRALVHADLGDLDAAIADYERAIEIAPDHAAAYSGRGNVRRMKGDLVAALADFDRALELDPDDPGYLSNRGLVRLGLGELDRAEADFDRALALDPQLAIVHMNRGNVHRARGDHRAAIADYDRALEVDPRYAEALINRCLARHSLGDHGGAVADGDRAIELDPTQPVAYINRGNARSALGDVAGAIADYDRALELDPKSLLAIFNRGSARAMSLDFAGALADLDRAVEIDPSFPQAYSARGSARLALGDVRGAFADLARAMELDPTAAEVPLARGAARRTLGDLAGARADVEKAIELDPSLAQAHVERAAILRLQGEADEALGALGRALELAPKNATAWNTRAMLRQERNDLEGAIADYGRAIEANPRFAASYANRATARLRVGDAKGAVADLEKWLSLQPPAHPKAAEMRALLERARRQAEN